jgi:5-formyltetrahydrofolate cyclo-ligase
MDKSALRLIYTDIRSKMTKADVIYSSKQIAIRCLPLLNPTAQDISIYQQLASQNEIDPWFIASELSANTIDIVPSHKTAPIPTKNYDAIIIPCIAADLSGNRLGYGGGWYDRFLSRNLSATKIVLCYESCLVDSLPRESHDIQADYVITEKRVIKCAVE